MAQTHTVKRHTNRIKRQKYNGAIYFLDCNNISSLKNFIPRLCKVLKLLDKLSQYFHLDPKEPGSGLQNTKTGTIYFTNIEDEKFTFAAKSILPL